MAGSGRIESADGEVHVYGAAARRAPAPVNSAVVHAGKAVDSAKSHIKSSGQPSYVPEVDMQSLLADVTTAERSKVQESLQQIGAATGMDITLDRQEAKVQRNPDSPEQDLYIINAYKRGTDNTYGNYFVLRDELSSINIEDAVNDINRDVKNNKSPAKAQEPVPEPGFFSRTYGIISVPMQAARNLLGSFRDTSQPQEMAAPAAASPEEIDKMKYAGQTAIDFGVSSIDVMRVVNSAKEDDQP